MNKANNTTGYSMTYDAGSTGQLTGKKADYISDQQKYKSYGAPVVWTFHWQGYGSYKISVNTGGETEKWLKYDSTGLFVVDESEASVVNLTAGTGDYAGRIRISPILDNGISSISKNSRNNFQRGTISFSEVLTNAQYWHELITFNLNDPYNLDGKKSVCCII